MHIIGQIYIKIQIKFRLLSTTVIIMFKSWWFTFNKEMLYSYNKRNSEAIMHEVFAYKMSF